jgi:DNA-binding MarR family transcriptional regulator
VNVHSMQHVDIGSPMSISDETFAKLHALSTGLRRFERWSQQQAAVVGLTPAQHQLLLAIRGHDDPKGPTIRQVADYLLLRHQSAVGLVDRADLAGLVRRDRDADDHRLVRLRLTAEGEHQLERLSAHHLEELERLGPEIIDIWRDIGPADSVHDYVGVISPRMADDDRTLDRTPVTAPITPRPAEGSSR